MLISAYIFNPERPNAVWCSDITYLWTIDGFVYLASIMDLYSRKIITWTLANTLEVSCVIETINKAKARRKIEEPLIYAFRSRRTVRFKGIQTCHCKHAAQLF
ncbi:MAG: DDE-type integrase/transposase/recombinase [Lachnospiraceae bacterium]|nr:DDE-type integrase/transposase/recombinase [Lachnospiraceae bacterium]